MGIPPGEVNFQVVSETLRTDQKRYPLSQQESHPGSGPFGRICQDYPGWAKSVTAVSSIEVQEDPVYFWGAIWRMMSSSKWLGLVGLKPGLP